MLRVVDNFLGGALHAVVSGVIEFVNPSVFDLGDDELVEAPFSDFVGGGAGVFGSQTHFGAGVVDVGGVRLDEFFVPEKSFWAFEGCDAAILGCVVRLVLDMAGQVMNA